MKPGEDEDTRGAENAGAATAAEGNAEAGNGGSGGTHSEPQTFAGTVAAKPTAMSTIEEVLETITHTSTPAASAGVLIDWSIAILKNALHLGGMAATSDAVKAHVALLEEHKDALTEAVAA